MFINIVITLLVMSVCSAIHPALPMARSTGLSSPKFQRDDAQLSFQYNTIYLHSSPSPNHDTLDHQPHHYNLKPTSFINIQYAPLVKPSSRLYTKVHSPHDVSIGKFEKMEAVLKSPSRFTPITTTVKTDHLEPKFFATGVPDLQPQPMPHLDYIPGHNIEVLRSVNRSPVTNAVFKNNPPSASPESINKLPQNTVKFIPPYKFSHLSNKRQQPEMSTENMFFSFDTAERKNTLKVTTASSHHVTTTMMPPPPQYQDLTYIFPRKRQQMVLPNPNAPNLMYNTMDVPAVENEPTILSAPSSQQKIPYMKMHTLLLNVARAYNMASAPHRSALHSGAKPAVIGLLQPYTQAYMSAPRLPPIPMRNPSNQKTILYPMQKNLRFAIHS